MYLGPNWDLVCGSRYNTGDGISLALRAGAIAHGNWTGVPRRRLLRPQRASAFGDINLLNQQKNYFSLGIVVNAEGQRFVDEGSDFRNYIYSGMGAKVLGQPGAIAWQIFDAKTVGLLPDEYRVRHATRLQADTLEALADLLMEGIDKKAFLRTIREFNASIDQTVPLPGRARWPSDSRPSVPKSNWAHPIDMGPFVPARSPVESPAHTAASRSAHLGKYRRR